MVSTREGEREGKVYLAYPLERLGFFVVKNTSDFIWFLYCVIAALCLF